MDEVISHSTEDQQSEITGWENMDPSSSQPKDAENITDQISDLPSNPASWDNMAEQVPFHPNTTTEEHSSLDESKHEKDRERLSESF